MLHTWQLLTSPTLEDNWHQRLHCPSREIYCRASLVTGLTYHPSFLPWSLRTGFSLKAEEAWALEGSLEPLCPPSLVQAWSTCKLLPKPAVAACQEEFRYLKIHQFIQQLCAVPLSWILQSVQILLWEITPKSFVYFKKKIACIPPFLAGPRVGYDLW